MNDFIDIYCERMGPGLWNEPMNALTNIAFVVAAFMVLKLAKEKDALDWRSGLLAGLIGVIALGSFLFHVFATKWAMVADTLPILAYQIAFLYLYADQIMQRGKATTFGLLGAFILTAVAVGFIPHDLLNGSLSYAPAFVFLTGLGFYHWVSGKQEEHALMMAAAIFLISLIFRTFDDTFCTVFPVGLHYIWHVLNALVLLLTARAYIVNFAPAK